MTTTLKKAKHELGSDPEEPCNTVDFPDRNARIAELAYYKAEQRNFEPGYELDDWLAAEREFIE